MQMARRDQLPVDHAVIMTNGRLVMAALAMQTARQVAINGRKRERERSRAAPRGAAGWRRGMWVVGCRRTCGWACGRAGRRARGSRRRLSGGGAVVVHCYGHGGSGVTLAMGCADAVLRAHLAPRLPPPPARKGQGRERSRL